MRDIPAPVLAVLGDRVQHLALFFRLELDTDPLFLWSGLGPKTYEGDVYQGVGDLLSVSSIAESVDLTAASVQFRLSGVPAELIGRSLFEAVRLRPVRIILVWFSGAAFDTALGGLELYRGFADTLVVTEGSDTAEILLNTENRLIELRRGTGRVWSGEDQRSIRDPNDTGFDRVAKLAELDLGEWGQ